MINSYSSLPSIIQLIFHFKSTVKAVKSYIQSSLCYCYHLPAWLTLHKPSTERDESSIYTFIQLKISIQ